MLVLELDKLVIKDIILLFCTLTKQILFAYLFSELWTHSEIKGFKKHQLSRLITAAVKKLVTMGFYNLLPIIFLLYISTLVTGHGNMVLPMAWWDKDWVGWAYNTSNHGYLTRLGCNVLDLPHDTEFEAQQDEKNGPDCMQFWFANNVLIPAEATLPPEMAQPETTCIGQRGARFLHEMLILCNSTILKN